SQKELGLFLMYCHGKEFEEISDETGIPLDIIAVTALSYDWKTKASEIRKYRNGEKIGEIARDMIETLLMATYVSMKKELAEVIAGRKDASEVWMIPKNIPGLEKLMKMVMETSKPAGVEPPKNGTVI